MKFSTINFISLYIIFSMFQVLAAGEHLNPIDYPNVAQKGVVIDWKSINIIEAPGIDNTYSISDLEWHLSKPDKMIYGTWVIKKGFEHITISIYISLFRNEDVLNIFKLYSSGGNDPNNAPGPPDLGLISNIVHDKKINCNRVCWWYYNTYVQIECFTTSVNPINIAHWFHSLLVNNLVPDTRNFLPYKPKKKLDPEQINVFEPVKLDIQYYDNSDNYKYSIEPYDNSNDLYWEKNSNKPPTFQVKYPGTVWLRYIIINNKTFLSSVDQITGILVSDPKSICVPKKSTPKRANVNDF